METETAAALDGFVSAMLEGHLANQTGHCAMCGQFSPCSSERIAMRLGLIPTRLWIMEDTPEWTVAERSDGHLICETDWRAFGTGRIIVFDVDKVRNPDPSWDIPTSSEVRAAWRAARAYIFREASDNAE